MATTRTRPRKSELQRIVNRLETANAKLIAAAPDLLAASKVALPHICSALCPATWPMGQPKPPHNEICQALRDAIAKATK